MKIPTRTVVAAIGALVLAACSAPPAEAPAASAAPAADYRDSRAEVVVLNFFDMYCPHCQNEAPKVNELHRLAQSRGLGSRIEFFGIGWGNSPMECEMFRKRFNPPYTLVPDRNKAISARFGIFRPPLLVALRRDNSEWTEFYRTGRIFGSVEPVFARISSPVR